MKLVLGLALSILGLCSFPDVGEARGYCGTKECREFTLQFVFFIWIMGIPALGAVLGWHEVRSRHQKNWLVPFLLGAAGGFVGWLLLAASVTYLFGSTFWFLSLIAPLLSSPVIWLLAGRLTRQRG